MSAVTHTIHDDCRGAGDPDYHDPPGYIEPTYPARKQIGTDPGGIPIYEEAADTE